MENNKTLLDCNVCSHKGNCYCKSNCVQVVTVKIYVYSFSQNIQSVNDFALCSNSSQPSYLQPIYPDSVSP